MVIQTVDTSLVPVGDRPTRLSSQQIDISTLPHLADRQRSQLLSSLDRYVMWFNQTPAFCPPVTQRMQMMPDFKPKRFKAYRVPEKLKSAVSAEIRRLIDLTFITPTD